MGGWQSNLGGQRENRLENQFGAEKYIPGGFQYYALDPDYPVLPSPAYSQPRDVLDPIDQYLGCPTARLVGEG